VKGHESLQIAQNHQEWQGHGFCDHTFQSSDHKCRIIRALLDFQLEMYDLL
jgi:hypothetical protein